MTKEVVIKNAVMGLTIESKIPYFLSTSNVHVIKQKLIIGPVINTLKFLNKLSKC